MIAYKAEYVLFLLLLKNFVIILGPPAQSSAFWNEVKILAAPERATRAIYLEDIED